MNAPRARILGCLRFDIETRIANGRVNFRPDLRNLATTHDYSEGQVKTANSADLVECLANGLEWLSGLSGHLLGKVREILCLLRQCFDLLTYVRNSASVAPGVVFPSAALAPSQRVKRSTRVRVVREGAPPIKGWH